MSVKVTVSGGNKAAGELRRIQRRMKRPEDAWRKIGRHVAREINKQFTSRGANFGTPWKPLAPSTIAEKRRLGFPRTPLVRTGQMKRDFTGSPMDIEQYSGSRATFGVSSPKAGWQHYGTTRNGRKHIPARKILVITPKLKKEIVGMMERHIRGLKGDK